MTKILIVEDDFSIANLIKEALEGLVIPVNVFMTENVQRMKLKRRPMTLCCWM